MSDPLPVTEPNERPAHDVTELSAIEAWDRLRLGGIPTSVDAVSHGSKRRRRKQRGKSVLYRLLGAGPHGEPVIAKHSRAISIAVEAHVYQHVLAPLDLDVPRCYGSVPAVRDGSAWLFLEDVTGETFREDDDEDRHRHHHFPLRSVWQHRSRSQNWGRRIHPACVS